MDESADVDPEADWPEQDHDFVEWAYRQYLRREPDEGGRALFLEELTTGSMTRRGLCETLQNSPERTNRFRDDEAMETFHQSRIAWTRTIPPARRILDLGGTALGDDRGALIVMGYPYSFDEEIVIELPPDARHALYQTPENQSVQTAHGTVTYYYRSMSELSDFADASFDLICSAQTFEHVSPDEGKHILSEARRLLASEGHLAIDTPNGALSSIQARENGVEVINPDHKKEYTHAEMLDLFDQNGLAVVRQLGIGYMPLTAASNTFQIEELTRNPGLYHDLERCYTLAYLLRRA